MEAQDAGLAVDRHRVLLSAVRRRLALVDPVWVEDVELVALWTRG